jgi:hypothetical protein
VAAFGVRPPTSFTPPVARAHGCRRAGLHPRGQLHQGLPVASSANQRLAMREAGRAGPVSASVRGTLTGQPRPRRSDSGDQHGHRLN